MFYSIELVYYATPSFISATQQYFGTEEDILSVLEVNKQTRPDLYEAAAAYFTGTGDGVAQVYQGPPEQFIKPIEVLHVVEHSADNFKFEHMNVWDCPYYMSASHVDYAIYYIKDSDEKLIRCVKAEFTDLTYSTDSSRGEYPVTGQGNWGHPGIIIDSGEHKVRNTLMFCERRFTSAEEFSSDLENPSDVNFSEFFCDVFGDG